MIVVLLSWYCILHWIWFNYNNTNFCLYIDVLVAYIYLVRCLKLFLLHIVYWLKEYLITLHLSYHIVWYVMLSLALLLIILNAVLLCFWHRKNIHGGTNCREWRNMDTSNTKHKLKFRLFCNNSFNRSINVRFSVSPSVFWHIMTDSIARLRH